MYSVFNNFHKNIEFTYEVKENGKIAAVKATAFRKKAQHSLFTLENYGATDLETKHIMFNSCKSLPNLLNSRISRSRTIF